MNKVIMDSVIFMFHIPSVVAVVQHSVMLTLRDPMDCSMPSFPVLHYHLEFAQTHVH